MKHFLQILISFLFISTANSQNIRNEKFGFIQEKDFLAPANAIENDDAAIVLSNVGSTTFEGNNSGNFTLVFKQHKKILLLKKSAFDEATFRIKLYQGNYALEEKIEDLFAATYTINNGIITESKLNKENVVTEKINRYFNAKKFTLPNVKEGCIIEYSYTLKSPFISHLRSWDFQEYYPTLWSEYQVTIPPMFKYVIDKKGDFKNQKLVDSTKNVFKNYTILFPGSAAFSSPEVINLSGDAKWYLWAMKDVPSYKKEDFIANHKSYITTIDFQLQSIKYSETNNRMFVQSWYETVEELLKSPDFGQIFDKEKNEWIGIEANRIVDSLIGLEAAKKIFYNINQAFNCDDYDAIKLSDEIKKIYKQKKGNVADINLLLTAMLRSQGFEANPVIISTRGSGKITETTAILDQFNYLICELVLDSNTTFFLDASKPKIGFGKIPAYCYNGFGRRIATTPILIDLSANKFQEDKTTTFFLINAGNKIEGSYESKLGNNESIGFRNDVLSKTNEIIFKEIKKQYAFDVAVENGEIENLKKTEDNIIIRYDIKFAFDEQDLIYFNPFLTDIKKENIFKAEKRLNPIEMPHTINEMYVLDMEVPTGYIVDELPKSIKSKFNEDEGVFEYIITNKENHLQLHYRFSLFLANYETTDYDNLRTFYGLMLKKQAEQIVFKKIKK